MSNKILGVATQVMIMAIIISVILLFVGIGVLVFIHVCIVGRAFRSVFGNSALVGRDSIQSASMSQDDLEKLPCFDFIAKDKGSSPVDCAVCLENFKVGDKCRLLPTCRHSFHAQCVDAWLLKTPICPICRASADASKARSVVDEQSSHFSDTSRETRESQTTGSSNPFSDISIELRENQSIESSPFGDVIMESRVIQTLEITRQSHIGIESRENQTNLVGIRLNSNPSPSQSDSAPELAV